VELFHREVVRLHVLLLTIYSDQTCYITYDF
jgi:hypothetical protein